MKERKVYVSIKTDNEDIKSEIDFGFYTNKPHKEIVDYFREFAPIFIYSQHLTRENLVGSIVSYFTNGTTDISDEIQEEIEVIVSEDKTISDDEALEYSKIKREERIDNDMKKLDEALSVLKKIKEEL